MIGADVRGTDDRREHLRPMRTSGLDPKRTSRLASSTPSCPAPPLLAVAAAARSCLDPARFLLVHRPRRLVVHQSHARRRTPPAPQPPRTAEDPAMQRNGAAGATRAMTGRTRTVGDAGERRGRVPVRRRRGTVRPRPRWPGRRGDCGAPTAREWSRRAVRERSVAMAAQEQRG